MRKALLRTREMKLTSSKERQTAKLLAPLSEKERLDFDWSQSNEKGTDEEISEVAVLKQPFDVAYGYLRGHLGPQFTG